MPIYEYRCRDCQSTFEVLINRSTEPRCPGCAGGQLDKLISTFSPAAGNHEAGPQAELPACGTCGVPGGPCAMY